MKRILIFIILSLIYVNGFNQNTIQKKVAIITDWIIYQGDTLGIYRVNGDTLFTEQGSVLDTIVMGGVNYWTLTGSDIQNNNAGDVYLHGMTRPDSVNIDSLRGTHPGIEITQVDSVLQDLSANTGTDYALATNYLAFKFTASASSNYRTVGLRVKKDGSITNVAAYVQYKIYTDNAGVPGTNLSTGFENLCYGYVTTSYVEYVMQIGGSLLTSGASYWIVIIPNALPSGGNIYFDTQNTGTALAATSTNGSSWTPVNNATGWLKFYYCNEPALEVNAQNYYGIYAYSRNSYGVEAESVFDPGLRGTSINNAGIIGRSTYGIGMYGLSTHENAIQGISTNGVAIAGASTTNNGIDGQTSASNKVGVRGYGATGIGVYGQSGSNFGVQALSTSNYAIYALSPHTTSGVAYLLAYPSTTDFHRVLNITRETTGTPAAGMGGSIDFFVENSSGSDILQGRIGVFSQKVTASSERGAIGFYTKGDNNPPTLKVIIDSTGRVGIGTAAPTYNLEVTGNAYVTTDFRAATVQTPYINAYDFVKSSIVNAYDTLAITADTLIITADPTYIVGNTTVTGTLEVNDTVKCAVMQADQIKDIQTLVTCGYTIPIFVGSHSSPADATTYYFGLIPNTAPSTTAEERKIYIPKAGKITFCSISSNATTAGTDEAWPYYIRLNNSTDYGIDTVSVSANLRQWINSSMNITVAAGDYIEIKSVTPTWATNPAAVSQGGYIYIEQ